MQNQEANTVAEIVVKEMVSCYWVPLAFWAIWSPQFSLRCAGYLESRTTPQHTHPLRRDGWALQLDLGSSASQVCQWSLERLGSSSATTDGGILHVSPQYYWWNPCNDMMGCDLRLPVDLFIGRPEDEPPEQRSDYAQNLLNQLEKVHDYVWQYKQLVPDHLVMRICPCGLMNMHSL